jgi:hypothetical protein
MSKVYIVSVKGVDGMMNRHAPRDGMKKVPFECQYDTLEELEAALRRSPVVGSQIIFTPIQGSYQCRIRKRIGLRLTYDNCGAIRESTFEYLEPEDEDEVGKEFADR